MKAKVNRLEPEAAKKVLVDFINVYLDKGFGVMNKTEIETLLFHVFKKNGLLSGKCFDDSFTLQITESKARKLIYESQVKYTYRDKDELVRYLRTSIGECLKRANFSHDKTRIKFAVEDKYLRVALNAYLRDFGYFSDTSFNTDIVSLDHFSFVKFVTLLVPNYQVDDILEKVNLEAVSEDTKEKTGESFWLSLIKDLAKDGTKEGLKLIGMWILSHPEVVAAI